jgi:hypothetical protein
MTPELYLENSRWWPVNRKQLEPPPYLTYERDSNGNTSTHVFKDVRHNGTTPDTKLLGHIAEIQDGGSKNRKKIQLWPHMTYESDSNGYTHILKDAQ